MLPETTDFRGRGCDKIKSKGQAANRKGINLIQAAPKGKGIKDRS